MHNVDIAPLRTWYDFGMDKNFFASTTIVLLIAVLSISLLLIDDMDSPEPVIVPDIEISENTSVTLPSEAEEGVSAIPTFEGQFTEGGQSTDMPILSEMDSEYVRMQDSCITVPSAYWENPFEAARI